MAGAAPAAFCSLRIRKRRLRRCGPVLSWRSAGKKRSPILTPRENQFIAFVVHPVWAAHPPGLAAPAFRLGVQILLAALRAFREVAWFVARFQDLLCAFEWPLCDEDAGRRGAAEPSSDVPRLAGEQEPTTASAARSENHRQLFLSPAVQTQSEASTVIVGEIRAVPVGSGSSMERAMEAALKALDRSGLEYEVGPLGTSVEAKNLDDVLEAFKRVHDAVARIAPRVLLELSVDHRTDKTEDLVSLQMVRH